ncbi:MAG: nitroreductase family protein [Planctomycetota bacterium]|jgi:nitroreductase
MTEPRFVPLAPRYRPAGTPAEEARSFYEKMASRRSIRMFSDHPVSRETIEWIVRAASTAPSGANKQPWRFVAVEDAAIKRKIRLAAEREEREFYERRASERWLKDLEPLGTDDHKEFLEVAPWLLVVFALARGEDGAQHYYVQESIGLAAGMLLTAAHLAGLATLTHTPSPMGFLNKVLERPDNERPFLLIPIGYPADDCVVPAHALEKKKLEEVLVVR